MGEKDNCSVNRGKAIWSRWAQELASFVDVLQIGIVMKEYVYQNTFFWKLELLI